MATNYNYIMLFGHLFLLIKIALPLYLYYQYLDQANQQLINVFIDQNKSVKEP